MPEIDPFEPVFDAFTKYLDAKIGTWIKFVRERKTDAIRVNDYGDAHEPYGGRISGEFQAARDAR